MNVPVTPADPATPLEPGDFDMLDSLLDALRQRDDEVPQWEFCEGAMAALLCTRRPIPPSEYLPVLLGSGESGGPDFADESQATQFMALWTRRWNEVAAALAAKVDTLEDERSYHPEVMDVRGAVASLPEAERAEIAGQDLPAYAQVWALGFMFVVENWPDDWAAPRDPETASWLDGALDAVVTLTEDDTGRPTLSLHSEDGPPSVSEVRLNQFGEALWAVYDLHQLWHSLGPRVEPVRRTEMPGRNDPCPCGSGKNTRNAMAQAERLPVHPLV